MMNIYGGKKIVIGVSGSIAAFKVAGWVSTLAKAEAMVSVIMTSSASKFVTPLTFSSLSGLEVYTDMFAHDSGETMAHINLGRDADIIIVAPASAQTIGRLAHGLADDLLSTTVLASRAPVYICPAMNSRMYTHPATQANLKLLREYGYVIIDPDEGMMACKEEGKGRLVEWEQVDPIIQKELSSQDLAGQRILVTAGPTREPIDPARFLSNRSSGKMGFAIAQAAYRRGAEVTLITGPTSLSVHPGITRIDVETALQMQAAVIAHAQKASVVIKAAAVSDYRPAKTFENKVKKHQIEGDLSLASNPDILLELGKCKKKKQILVGFAAETENFEVEARKKLIAKNLDMIAVNNINSEDTGFATDTNQLTLLTEKDAETLPLMSKERLADKLIDRLLPLLS